MGTCRCGPENLRVPETAQLGLFCEPYRLDEWVHRFPVHIFTDIEPFDWVDVDSATGPL